MHGPPFSRCCNHAITTYPIFLIMFRGREYIPPSVGRGEEPAIEPSSVLADKWGAVFGFGSVLLTATLGVLVGTSIPEIPL
jgi:hypothetical protein